MSARIKAAKPTLRVLIKEPGKEIYEDTIPMTASVINSYLGESWSLLGVMRDVAVLWPTAGRPPEKAVSGYTNKQAAPGLPNCEIFGHHIYGPCIMVGYNWAKELLEDIPDGLDPAFAKRYCLRTIGGKR